MWLHSLLLALVFFSGFFVYAVLEQKSLTLYSVSLAVLGAADVMLGLSFAMSGFCYYFDFLDHKLAYRKYFGLVGYWLALLYTALVSVLEPDRYWYGLRDNLLSADILLGMGAMVILTFMMLISNNRAMRAMGVANWRRGLRLGYLAYFMLIVRAMVIEWDVWVVWWQTLDNLPPVRLVVSLFAMSVLLLRGSMLISKAINPRKGAECV